MKVYTLEYLYEEEDTDALAFVTWIEKMLEGIKIGS